MDFVVQQAATILNAVVQQQTGQAAVAQINNAEDFISTADTALKTGRDPVLNAISQVWRNTVFAARGYDNPLATLRFTAERWGNATRKLSPEAAEMEDDERYLYPVGYDANQTDPYGNGLSVDMWKIRKQKVVQTNFYGSLVYEQVYTIFQDQFDVAFTSPEEFVRFNAMNLTERMNDRASYEEAKARLLQVNFIGALLDENNSERVIHLLTEYNTATGLVTPLTATTVMQPDNFEAFIRWMYARIKTIVGLMRHRSNMFQTVLTGKNILRHTDAENVRVALYTPFMEMINSMVLSNLYNADMMRLPTYEAIDFWQSIKSPQTIKIEPHYTGANGSPKNGSAVDNSTVIGLIHDRDAIGYNWISPRALVTPVNAAGAYYNEFYHARFATLSDNTEKGVVLCLD